MCKRWQLISNMSWTHMKFLNDDPDLWGMTLGDFNYKEYNKNFESVIKICGRFLTHIDLSKFLNQGVLNLIKTECPNVQNIDFNDCYYWVNKKNDIEDIKPIFNKVRKFKANFRFRVTDEDLKIFFSMNDKLEYLNLCLDRDLSTFTFLDALPHKTLRELIIHADIPLHIISHVSFTF